VRHGIHIILVVEDNRRGCSTNNGVSLALPMTAAMLYPEIKPQASGSELSEMVSNLLRWYSTVRDMEIPGCYAQHRPARPTPPHRLVRASSRAWMRMWMQVHRCGTGIGAPRTPATYRPTCSISLSVTMVDRTATSHCACHARGAGSVGASVAMVAARHRMRKAMPWDVCGR